jgi:hypothetical protein
MHDQYIINPEKPIERQDIRNTMSDMPAYIAEDYRTIGKLQAKHLLRNASRIRACYWNAVLVKDLASMRKERIWFEEVKKGVITDYCVCWLNTHGSQLMEGWKGLMCLGYGSVVVC